MHINRPSKSTLDTISGTNGTLYFIKCHMSECVSLGRKAKGHAHIDSNEMNLQY